MSWVVWSLFFCGLFFFFFFFFSSRRRHTRWTGDWSSDVCSSDLDLLHAGHIETLRAARALGDYLVVCLNSDASVGRLKGAGRPLVPATDREIGRASCRERV